MHGFHTERLKHDAEDFGARRISCPLLVLWGSRAFVGREYDVLDVRRAYADHPSGAAIDSGHFVPEERPAETSAHLLRFLAA